MLLELIAGILTVFIAAVLFVNTIEYLGCKFGLGSSFVGAILSPLFTSLPELTVFLVAILSGLTSGEEIGVGTIFGQPFMASSLSYGLVGLSAFLGYILGKRRSSYLEVDRSLIFPYVFVTIFFPMTALPAFIDFRYAFGFAFLAVFVFYMWIMYKRREADKIDYAELPYFCRFLTFTHIVVALVQLVFSVILLYYGSKGLVSAVDGIAREGGLSPFGVALVVIPAATAIPETASALIWGHKGRDTLSLGSLVGEKILYSTFYPGLAMLVTSWRLDVHAYLSIVTTTFVSLILLYFISKERVPWYCLCTGFFFFGCYTILVFIFHI